MKTVILTPLTGFAYIDSENTDLTVGSLDDPAAIQSTSDRKSVV